MEAPNTISAPIEARITPIRPPDAPSSARGDRVAAPVRPVRPDRLPALAKSLKDLAPQGHFPPGRPS